MKTVIHELFIDPPLAIARLGGSSIPQDGYRWIPAPAPRSGESTSIAPDWSLSVQQDGTVEPYLPPQLTFRDGPLIRPVCPFFEIWARIGSSNGSPRHWTEVPLTPALLAQTGATVADLSLRIDAKNFKAARRTGNVNLRYGTFPPVMVSGDTHLPVALWASSPNGVSQPMIPVDRPIPLGFVQMLKSRAPLPPSDARASVVDVERLRFRFTPAQGLVYGVPAAAKSSQTPRGGHAIPVDKSRAFLNPFAGWAGATDVGLVEPDDTFDGADVRADTSLGVIDDTCEVRFELSFAPAGGGAGLTASAHAFVGPPDFAPDRRPFLSLADELNDRGSGSEARTHSMSQADRDAWTQDLFERVFETTTLFNVDFYRSNGAAKLSGKDRAAHPVKGDHLPNPSRAMGGRDMLRKKKKDEEPIAAPNRDVPLPLSQRAVSRHRELSDLSGLREFIEAHRGRIKELVRRPFDIHPGENTDVSTMRMPPFMRNSNAEPLTLSAWQYDLLMSWVDEQESRPKGQKPKPTKFEQRAKARRADVLARARRVAADKP
jgi:hypothetical protein